LPSWTASAETFTSYRASWRHRVPFLVAELGPDVDPFILHLFAALAEKDNPQGCSKYAKGKVTSPAPARSGGASLLARSPRPS
jgi:hypothetical protein